MRFIGYFWYRSFLICLVLLQAYESKSQCKQTYSWAFWQNFTGREATGTLLVDRRIIGVTMTANYDFFSTSDIYRLDRFSGFSGYTNIPNSTVPATEWSKGAGGTTTICFAEPVTNPILLYTSLGRANPNDYQNVTLKFSEPYTVVYDAGGTTFIDSYSLSGLEGNAVLLFPGTFSCITIYSEGTEFNTNLNWGLLPPPFPVSISEAKECNKASLTAQGGTTYKWSGGDNPTNAVNTVRTSGVYSVTATDQNGCTSIASKQVTVSTNATLASTVSKTICQGESYLGYQSSGTYTNAFKTSGGCDSTRTLNLSVLQIPTVTLEATKGVCSGQNVALNPTITPANTQLSYRWSTGETIQNISVRQAGVYSVTVANGICTNTASTRVVVNQLPTIQADEKICLESAAVTLSSGATAPDLTYLWKPTNSTGATLVVSQSGSYNVTVTSPAGCQASRTIDVRAAGFCGATIFAPDSFTPNGDQVNDLFNVIVVDGTPVRLTIYDRWGSVIYSEENNNPRWDGTYKGDKCLTGVYPYVLSYKALNGDEIFEYRNKLTLVR